MLTLPITEKSIFIAALIVYFISALIASCRLSKDSDKFRRLLQLLIIFAVSLQVALLSVRSVSIKAMPLTGLFESMIVLTIVFGVTFLCFSILIRRVWFDVIMTWIILAITLLTAAVAEPASVVQPVARRPWVIAHGLTMVISAAMITFAAGIAVLFLIARWRLKHKQIKDLIGKIPNMEKLERMNLLGLEACFIMMTFGIISGMGFAVIGSASMQMSLLYWLGDSKIVLIIAVWLLVMAILLLHRVFALKPKTMAYMTVIAFILVVFAIAGTGIFCGTAHDFTVDNINTPGVTQ